MTKDELYIKKIYRKIGKAIHGYELIKEGDRIAVGVSGGKDSYILLEALAEKRNYIPVNYELEAIHIDIENIDYETDRTYLEELCARLKVPFTYHSVKIQWEETDDVSPCFACSWNRRKELFDLCGELKCNKLALGHHRDDIVETFVMNMIYQGSLSAMPPSLDMFDGEITVIRPLSLVPEEKLIQLERMRNYPPQKKECPYGDNTGRNAVKEIIRSMEKLNPHAQSSIYKAMSNIHHEYLPPKEQKGKVKKGRKL